MTFVRPHPLAALALLAGCPGDTDKDTTPTGGTDSGDTSVAECGLVPATVASATPLTCADPGLRSTGNFVHKRAVSAELDGAYLESGGLAVGDVDHDGLLDLFVANERTSQLWRNAGNSLWSEVSDPFDGADLSRAVGGVFVDHDGDGDLDLCVTRYEEPNVLLRNDGSGNFTEVLGAFTGHSWRTQSASWADVDRDGDLDVYFGSYGPKPETYTTAQVPADPGELYLNNGDGTFTEASELVHQDVHDGYAFTSAFYDIDGDFYPELFQFNDFGATQGVNRTSRMLKNGFATGDGFLQDVQGNYIDRAFEDMGIGVADLNDDGLPDFAITSWKKVELLQSIDATVGWVETPGVIVIDTANRNQVYGWGADFGDIDNDGDLDLAMNFGYWSTYDGAGDPLVQVDGLWIQDAAGAFENLAAEPEWAVNDKGMSRGVLLADVNDDGYLDVLKRQLDDNAPTLQHLSQCGDASFLRVELRQEGLNQRAIGAVIEVTRANGQVQRRWIQAGSASMYVGHPPEAHFGLGSDESVDVRILWPDCATSELTGVATGQRVVVERG